MAVRNQPATRRPDLLLLAPTIHFELGSALRSAAGLGWERAFLEDGHSVWFGCERAIRSEGRAAARRGRNDLLLVPCLNQPSYVYPDVTIVTRRRVGRPLHRVNLARGPRQLVVIPDESNSDFDLETAHRFGQWLEVAHLELPISDFVYHYRLATIALAEVARQVGRRPTMKITRPERPPIYDHALEALAQVDGHAISAEELLNY